MNKNGTAAAVKDGGRSRGNNRSPNLVLMWWRMLQKVPDVRWEHEMVHVSQAEGKRNQAEALLQDARRRVAAAFWFL